ncbi:MAG: SDR family oxidoreductase [Clostridia bacterium]|nr:SDR family oxidoreductase [Clostridia bacterium]
MKKVLITGGNGGIAQAIKELLESKDYDVFAPSRSELDVTDWNSIDNAIKNYVPDILINNAGYVVPCSIKEANLENAKKHIDINLSGTFYCAQIGLKYNPNLEIINIASAAAVEVHATWSEYCATKAAVVMATKCWAEDGIFTVSISPGRTRTKMRKSLYPDEDQSTLLEPNDFAKVVYKAILHDYPSGSNIIVRKQNVMELLSN